MNSFTVKSYWDSYNELSRDIKKQADTKFEFWKEDPFHPSLRLHPMRGRLTGLHSVSISMSYRITLELELREQEIVFVNVGSHGEVY